MPSFWKIAILIVGTLVVGYAISFAQMSLIVNSEMDRVESEVFTWLAEHKEEVASIVETGYAARQLEVATALREERAKTLQSVKDTLRESLILSSDRMTELLDGYADDMTEELDEVWDYIANDNPSIAAVCQVDEWLTALWFAVQQIEEYLETGSSTHLEVAAAIIYDGTAIETYDVTAILCKRTTDGGWLMLQ